SARDPHRVNKHTDPTRQLRGKRLGSSQAAGRAAPSPRWVTARLAEARVELARRRGAHPAGEAALLVGERTLGDLQPHLDGSIPGVSPPHIAQRLEHVADGLV